MTEMLELDQPQQTEGLTPEQQAENLRLMENLKENDRAANEALDTINPNLRSEREREGEQVPLNATDNIISIGVAGIDTIRAARAEKRAVKHFEKNDDAYIGQAQIEDAQRSEQKAA